MRLPRVHAATITGRLRTDPGLLVLIGLVVALTTALTSSVAPVAERTADRAMAASVADAQARSNVVATLPEWYDEPRSKERVADTAAQLDQEAEEARGLLPAPLVEVLRPGVTVVTTPALQLLDAGPGRLLQIAYVDPADGAPSVRWTEGNAPRASVGDDAGDSAPGADPWPVQVGVSEAVAQALDVRVGQRIPAKDEKGRALEVRISGTFVAADEDEPAWQVSTRLLEPVEGVSEGQPFASGAALVSSESLPDLRFALPGDLLTRRVVFAPDPDLVRWRDSTAIEQAIGSLQSSGGLVQVEVIWDSLLGGVLQDGRAQVASARGQAQVLLVGLLACALLVLVLAAQLLVRRRTASLSMVRQRGAALLDVAATLLLESLVVGAVGAVVGLGAARLLVGSPGWGWSVPVLLVAASASPVLGAVAAQASGARRVPANRSARRTAARTLRLQRLALEGVVLAGAALSFVALRQRGVVGEGADGGGDLTAASTPTWWALAGAVLLLRLLPPAMRWALAGTRRSTRGVSFFVAARLTETGARALPVLLTCVALAQLTFGLALAATAREGQAAAALSAVGGDARLDAAPDAELDAVAEQVAKRPGVNAGVAARVEDGVQVVSPNAVESVRVVVVDAAAYKHLLDVSALADAPQLARLGEGTSDSVPVLLLGGDPGLRDAPILLWEDDRIAIDVVGTAPDVDDATAPVVVVDAEALAGAGVVAPPDTLWVVGPGAADAIDAAATEVSDVDSVVHYDDELSRRRDAPLPSGVTRLAMASSVLLLALALLGSVLAAVADAPARAQALGRLRALGLPHRDLRRVLVGELVLPVAVAGLAGVALGVSCAYAVLGSLSLERLTGQLDPPVPAVPWWTALAVVALVVTVLVVAALEWARVRRRSLAQLLRS